MRLPAIAPLVPDLESASVPSATVTEPDNVLAVAPSNVIVSGARSTSALVPEIWPLNVIGPLFARQTASDPVTATALLNVAVPVPSCVTSSMVSGSPPTV